MADAALERAAAKSAPAEILAALLDAWADNRHPSIVELVDAAARRALETRAPRKLAATLAERHAQWLTVARARDPLDLDWLIASLIPSRVEQARERLTELDAWPDDPRIVIGLLGLCRTKPLVTHRPLWTQIFRAIRKRLAPHAIPVVAELAAISPVTAFDQYLRGKLARLADDDVASVTEPDASVVARIASSLDLRHERASRRTADDLFREVWANAADDGPRQVLADWLTERGDPRGELVALQLARVTRSVDATAMRRERALLAEHGRAWLGPLEPVIVSNAFLLFERGFVRRCEVAWRRLAALPPLMTHPAWSTVREYRLSSDGDRACDAWLDHMIALGAKRL